MNCYLNELMLTSTWHFFLLFDRICSSHWPVVWQRSFNWERLDNKRVTGTVGIHYPGKRCAPCTYTSSVATSVHTFSKNVHDDLVLVSIQTMSCRDVCKYSSKVNVNKNQIYISIPIMKVEDQIYFDEIVLDLIFFDREYATFCAMTQNWHCI